MVLTDVRVGAGDTARAGDHVTMRERTTLLNGTVIFDNRNSGNAITFELGANQVIKGVDEGITGMRTGGVRRLIVPPSLSQRRSYPANTPPDSTLRIEVELFGIRRKDK
ncbi:MAG: FKBP-type peptidyl-prolyl cis-trans isomerase [Gemmatimonas sp.]